ncbi:MAG: SRPBCC domain-containing protein [Proteobacteria bacterium]|nr:SRPBCC domain-containing protein [Pseudomonadota bacterium]
MQEEDKLAFDPDAVVVSQSVIIDASAEKVWKVLVDFGRYGEWNPFCVAAEGTLALGEPLKMTLKNYLEPGGFFDNTEFFCTIDAPHLISWEAPWVEEWPYPARRDQIIEPLSTDQCRYHSTDAFLGPHGIHVMRFAGPWVKRAFDDTAFALKAYVEAMT